MLIKVIILENFRAYRARTVIPFSALTAFIGRNDVGKSTILEALDIFFEGGTVKIESADASKGGDPKNVRIGVVFAELPPGHCHINWAGRKLRWILNWPDAPALL